MATITKTLTANAYRHVDASSPSANLSGAVFAKNTYGGLVSKMAYLGFSGAEIFASAKITSAVLTINGSGSSGAISLFPLSAGYNPNNVSYNAQGTTGGSVAGSASGYISFDLTKLSSGIANVANGVRIHYSASTASGLSYSISSAYITVSYEATAPTLVSPLGGYIRPSNAHTFEWKFSGQSRAQIEFFYNGSWKTYSVAGATSTFTMPANTFPSNSSVRWRVKAWDASNLESAYSSEATLSTDDVPPLAPTLIRPIDMDVDSTKNIIFRWIHNSSLGSEQTGADVAWTKDLSSGRWNQTHVNGQNEFLEYASNTFPYGTIYWRVRTYNTENEVGVWSDSAAFFSIAAPDAPAIVSITQGTAKPTITWAASIQSAFEIVVKDLGGAVVYETGKISSIEKTYKITDFLDDDIYIFHLRVYNDFDLASAWTNAQLVLTTVKPTPTAIDCVTVGSGITITFSIVPDLNDTYMIYRRETGTNWIAIAIVPEGAVDWLDYSVASGREYEYKVRRVNAVEAFSDSEVSSMIWNAKHLHIAAVDDLSDEIRLNWHLNEKAFPQENHSIGGTMLQFVGRELPIVEFDGFRTKEISMSYIVRSGDTEEIMDFMRLCLKRKVLLVRDKWGRKNYGSILNPTQSQNRWGVVISFSLACVDYNEEVKL